MGFVAAIFWLCALLLVHTHLTYALSLELLARLRPPRRGRPPAAPTTPRVSLIIAAQDRKSVV